MDLKRVRKVLVKLLSMLRSSCPTFASCPVETDRRACFKRRITLTIGTFINEHATSLPLLQESNRPICPFPWNLNISMGMSGSQY